MRGCQLVASVEKSTAHEIVRQLTRDNSSGGNICAFHLRSVLMAGPELKASAKLLFGEASVFELLAENMRNHVLKHEAVRHRLSTNAEYDAVWNGLARLVGSRNTVTPVERSACGYDLVAQELKIR